MSPIDRLDPMPQLNAWLGEVRAYLDAAHPSRDELDAVRDALACGVPPNGHADGHAPSSLPVADRWLADAVERVAASHAALAPIARGIAALAPALRWYRRPTEQPDPVFEHGHANAIVIGGAGLAALGGLIVGVTVMAPRVAYPLHRHPPDEAYVVLSDGEWWRETAGWWTPGAGGLVINDGGARHTMRAGDTPLLAVWFLTGGATQRGAATLFDRT